MTGFRSVHEKTTTKGRTMDIMTIPRRVLGLNLELARLPLTAYERVARGGDGSWAGAIAFDTAEAAVKEAFGNLWHDEQLLTDARLQRAKAQQLRTALEREAEAEAKRAQADTELERRRTQAEAQRERVEETNEARRQRLEQEKQQAKQQLAEEAAQKKAAARKVTEAQTQQVKRQEQEAEKRRLAAEANALREQERALAAQERAQRLETAAAVTKKARTSS
jgi:hypothetical protein